MNWYRRTDGSVYGTDAITNDQLLPPKPVPTHIWDNAIPAWRAMTQAESDLVRTTEMNFLIDDSRMQKLNFEVNFDQENRIRALETRPSINRTQYRDALAAAYRQLA